MKPIIGITVSTDDGRLFLNHVYFRAILECGGVPILLPYDEGAIDTYLSMIDGLLLSGGGDIHASHFGQEMHPLADFVYPARDSFELLIARAALDADMPILGICRGMQLLNVAMGGDLLQHIEGHSQSAPRPAATHDVEIFGKLAEMLNATAAPVNSIHHQAIGRIAKGLMPAAKSPDGIIEAVYAPAAAFCVAVQWHPEEMIAEYPIHRRLFEVFVKSVSRNKEEKR